VEFPNVITGGTYS